MSEQQSQTTATAEKPSDAWGQPITPERQAELHGYLDRWAAETDHGDRTGPFDLGRTYQEQVRHQLSGADVSWLVEQSRYNERGWGAYNLHLEGARLDGAHLEGAFLQDAHLEDAALFEAHLEGARISFAHLEKARLDGAHLEGADLSSAHLEGADLRGISFAHLEGTDLRGAHLEGKMYEPADPDFERILRYATNFPAMLPPADLRGTVLDAATNLKNITLGDARRGTVRVADVRWGGANLAVVDWIPLIEPMTELGDERAAWQWKPAPFEPPEGKPSRQELRAARAKHEQAQHLLDAFRAAVRANRQLATALSDQGLNEEADRFAYRAQVLQRRVFQLQHRRGRSSGSWFLDRISGYGYRPMRSLITYLLVVGGFAAAYYLISFFLLSPTPGPVLSPLDAIVFSLTSFHGRGFVPNESIGLSNPLTVLAAVEAFVGLLIEIVFIATFTNRFFAR